MRKFAITAAAGALALSACATNPYYNDGYRTQNTQASRAVTGAAVGAVVGGVAGAVIPGVSVATGAIAGGIAGAVLGATINGRQYYRDTQGYCYYVDQYGRPIYEYNTRC
jgi:uncharacterized protein YcfJ